MDIYKSEAEATIMDWLLKRVGAENFTPGLERISPLFAPIVKSYQQKKMKVVTIAGSNGKGESAHALAHLLRRDGIGYTMWTSPHILTIRERFQSSKGHISYSELSSELHSSYQLACAEGIDLSFYELLFFSFCRWSLKMESEWTIFEVGLGGRLDAVNLFDADLTVITSISREHQEILGNSYCSILKEKLGICRPRVPLISALELRFLQNIVQDYASDRRILWRDLFASSLLLPQDNFSLRNRSLAMLAYYQVCGREWSGGREELLKAVEGVSSTSKGRQESYYWSKRKCTFIGSHNPDGIRKLIGFLEERGEGERFDHLIISFSQRSPIDLENCIKQIAFSTGLAKRIVITSFVHARSEDQQTLQKICQQFTPSVEFAPDYSNYLQQQTQVGEHLLFTGSYYFIGEVQKYFLSLES
jgi:dihydrofolate synthase / folylpolyglutamate synthase